MSLLNRTITGLAIMIIGLFVLSPTSYAADLFGDDICKGTAADSTVCKSKAETGNPIYGEKGVMTRAIDIISLIVGIVAVIMLVVGGLRFITSGDNPQEVGKARTTVIMAIVGLIVALMAQVIVQMFLKKLT